MHMIYYNRKRAEEALNQHKKLGAASKLSIVEVAQLMDILQIRANKPNQHSVQKLAPIHWN